MTVAEVSVSFQQGDLHRRLDAIRLEESPGSSGLGPQFDSEPTPLFPSRRMLSRHNVATITAAHIV